MPLLTGLSLSRDPGSALVMSLGAAARAHGQGGAQVPEASFPVVMVSGVPVVAAPEEIDVTNAAALRAALLQAAAHGARTLVVDMSQTQFCDSAGLHVLVRAHYRAQAESGEMRLVIRGAPVRRIFAVTGLDRVIPSFPSLEQALRQSPAAPASASSPASPQVLGS